jgi:uncharacterized protein
MVHPQESGIHGQGLFASAAIPARTRIIQYIGERITKAESLRRCEEDNRYIFALDDEFDVDGNVPKNLARFANHSCSPNCESELDDGAVWLIALRDIAAGEEITYNYGYDLEEYPDYPCQCGSPGCVGFIVAEEFFNHVRSKNGGDPADALGNAFGVRV